jgi:type II pantothenate kinase
LAKLDGSPTVGVLDRFPGRLVPFPLLADPHNYDPDIVDLTRTDKSMLNYWLDLLDTNLNGLVDMAIKSQPVEPPEQQPTKELLEKIDEFKTLFRRHIGALRVEPAAYGTLTLRGLLSLREQCLHEVGLPDIFASVKRRENEAALQALPTLIQKLNGKSVDECQQIQSLVHGVLAGNMFDVFN